MRKHPELKKKLSLLYALGLAPEVRTSADLARHLKVSRQAVSSWVTGTQTTLGDQMPAGQIGSVASLFGIPPHWFTLPFAQFDDRVRRHADQAILVPQRPKRLSLAMMPPTEHPLIDRERELEQLDKAWASGEKNIVEVTGTFGIGKSALVNHWLSRLDMEDFRGAQRVFAWSFPSDQEDAQAMGSVLVEQALRWFGDENPTNGLSWNLTARLVDRIREQKTILILDGIDRLQRPRGSENLGIDCEPAAALVRELAAGMNGLCVVTSRVSLIELKNHFDNRRVSIHLRELNPRSSAKLFKALRIRGGKRQLRQARDLCAGHPLSLLLLAQHVQTAGNGLLDDIATVDATGNSNIATIIKGHASARDRAVRIFRECLTWFPDRLLRQLFCLLGMVGEPMVTDELERLLRKERIAGLTDELRQLDTSGLNSALRRLRHTKLVSLKVTGAVAVVQCQPAVAMLVNLALPHVDNSTWVDGQALLFRYLSERHSGQPRTEAHLRTITRAVRHGVNGGLVQESFDFYFKEIRRNHIPLFAEDPPLVEQSRISAFFLNQWDQLHAALGEWEKHYLLSLASANFIKLGQFRLAVEPARLSFNWFAREGRGNEAAATLEPLISMQLALGNIDDAVRMISDIRQLRTVSGNQDMQILVNTLDAWISFLAGNFQHAERLFLEVEQAVNQAQPQSNIPHPIIGSYYIRFLLHAGRIDEALACSKRSSAWRESRSWQLRYESASQRALDAVAFGAILMELGEIGRATEILSEQVRTLRARGELLHLSWPLRLRALCHTRSRRHRSAEQDMSEALRVAKQAGSKLEEWGCHLDHAIIHAMHGRRQEVSMHLRRAREVSGMEAYKFRNQEITALESFVSRSYGSFTDFWQYTLTGFDLWPTHREFNY